MSFLKDLHRKVDADLHSAAEHHASQMSASVSVSLAQISFLARILDSFEALDYRLRELDYRLRELETLLRVRL